MARKIDQIIVVDLEATCWQGEPPAGQEREIIEIGVCALDVASLKRFDKQSILVRPERSQISPFCTQLTTITQEQVDQEGLSFANALEHFQHEYRLSDRTWASYGDYDRVQMQTQCSERGLPYPFGRSHINVKNLLAVSLNLPYEIALDEASRRLDLPFEGTHHRGHDDAWNIAAVLAALFARIRKKT